MRNQTFRPGISALLSHRRGALKGKRIGLLSHAAAVDRTGASSAELLWSARGIRLAALLGPEHGFFGFASAGELTTHQKHPAWRIPIHSLYAESKRPSPRMLRDLDVIVLDLQDLGARPYTYVSTLRYLLEAADAAGKAVIVADRPIPLPRIVDGPVLDPACESFVGCVRTPVAYGMTPGEMALWLKGNLGLSLDLQVAAMRNYFRDPARGPDWPPWIPPSPGIRSWESAFCFPATVFLEALPGLDHGRTTGLPFQLLGSPWVKAMPFCEAMSDLRLPGVSFHPHPYAPPTGPFAAQLLDGVRLTVTNPNVFRPVLLGVSLIATYQRLYGRKKLWSFPGTRPEFFDKLFGTPTVREALMDGESGGTIAARWRPGIAAFRATREPCLLYPAT